ncbi:MAG: Na+/H+ antiporter subunit E [Thermoplasmata archaeon]
MKKSKAFTSTFLFALFVYLFLTLAAGRSMVEGTILWSLEELILGISIALIVGVVASDILCRSGSYRMLNPVRWVIMLLYCIPLFIEMIKANFDVAYRVITGKIEPGIVRIKPNLKTDLGITVLANSITLTPGTLTVDVDDENGDLYIHWIKVGKSPTKSIAGKFIPWIRRFAE